MVRSAKNRVTPQGKIEKPEDAEWRKWFDTLGANEHTAYLAKLGLDDQEIKELEADFESVKKGKKSKVLEDLESEANAKAGTGNE